MQALRTKMTLSFAFVALLMITILSLMANLMLDDQFKDYIIRQQERKNHDVLNQVNQQFDDGKWKYSNLENIGMNALEQGIILKVLDKEGRVIWDATKHNNGLCMQMLTDMAKNMNSLYPDFKGGYTQKEYSIRQQIDIIGTAIIGYYGPYYYTDNDLNFLKGLNNLLIFAGFISLLIAVLIGIFMSRRISNPIIRVIRATGLIAKGHYNERIIERSTTKEIYQLTQSINDLALTLNKQELLRKRLTADVAHELRTPLALLQSQIEAIRDGIWELDQNRLDGILEEINRLTRLVSNIERLTSIENEAIHKTEFHIKELIEDILRNIEVEYTNKQVRVILTGDDQLIMADKDKIKQVFMNVIGNSLKYTDKGGNIKISIELIENYLRIKVKDTGVGISEENLPYIFERFYRADPARNRKTGGSGIGLAIVKSVVEAHGGNVAAKSEMGKGTEIEILLPN